MYEVLLDITFYVTEILSCLNVRTIHGDTEVPLIYRGYSPPPVDA